jgi:hypothetical protein
MSTDPMCKCGKPESEHGRHGCPFIPASLQWTDADGPLITPPSSSSTATEPVNEVEDSSGNVFADLGMSNPEERLARYHQGRVQRSLACVNPHCDEGLIRGSLVGCAVCQRPLSRERLERAGMRFADTPPSPREDTADDEIDTICCQVESWRYDGVERSPLTVEATRKLASSLRDTRAELSCPWCDGSGAVPLGGYPDVNGFEREGPCPCEDGTLAGAFKKISESSRTLREELAKATERIDELVTQRADLQEARSRHSERADNAEQKLAAQSLAFASLLADVEAKAVKKPAESSYEEGYADAMDYVAERIRNAVTPAPATSSEPGRQQGEA